MPKPTISVRKAHSMTEELWLDKNGQWGAFENRKRFNDKSGTAQDDAEAFVAKHFGPDFSQFGLFPNS